ncbi:Rossmann-like domain-containing protein [Saccharothrix obliqua]|uniref:Rossmann-like domain-containing protein n=1 Tax=Saccharothrix obliqua TaxID=2861747 RepID=UPI001C5D3456|nr:DUF364 domain-containing protein [Saccharothrix obliqua]MBW4718129.1 hypothetical protein [Saccharothrix obliqua]
MTTSLDVLIADVLAGNQGPAPDTVRATSVFWVHHGTRLAGSTVCYRNNYVLARVGTAIGGCAFADGEVRPESCAASSGDTVANLLADGPTALRVAVLDAYLANQHPHRLAGAEFVLPAGTPEVRARARDNAVAALLGPLHGRNVALIGVVDPLVAAIRDRGGRCLPCDLDRRSTQWGDPITADMREVLEQADAVVATGMTLGNGTFDDILRTCLEKDAPLVVYAQSGSAVVRHFLGRGVTALSAEPFPFSQFSSAETSLYLYRARS